MERSNFLINCLKTSTKKDTKGKNGDSKKKKTSRKKKKLKKNKKIIKIKNYIDQKFITNILISKNKIQLFQSYIKNN